MIIHDLTFTVENGMPTCGTVWHQNVEISSLGKISEVGRNTQRIVMGSHSGTHMDSPYHFINDGDTMELVDINLMWGLITVVDFRCKGQGDVVTLEDIKGIEIKKRMLFAFGWYHNWKTDKYYDGFPYFETEAVQYMVDRGLKVMALDTPSPDNGKAINADGEVDSPNHMILLKNNIYVIEYLTNTDVLVGGKEYEIVALPLKIKGSDGAPGRVLIREEEV